MPERSFSEGSEKRTKSETKNGEEKTEKEKSKKQKKEKKSTKKDKKSEEKKTRSPSKPKSEASDWSLSLSGSDGWSRGSPERKARPLGDPTWEPEEDNRRLRRDRDSDRGYRTVMSKVTGGFRLDSYLYDRSRDRYGHHFRYEEREPNLKSHISRPNESADIYQSDASTKDSKKSRHKKDKKRKRKYHEKKHETKKKRSPRSLSDA